MTPTVLDHKVNAAIAEYNALRSEILHRSDIQNRIVQIHVTALTTVLGVAIVQPSVRWIVILIAVESSLFGLWFSDHVRMIAKLGKYIEFAYEDRVSNWLGSRVSGWEGIPRRLKEMAAPGGGSNETDKRYRYPYDLIYLSMLNLTFTFPAAAALVFTLPYFPRTDPLGVDRNPIYSSVPEWLAIVVWVVGLLAFISYVIRPRVSEEELKEIRTLLESEADPIPSGSKRVASHAAAVTES
jgi:hypothetical protein